MLCTAFNMNTYLDFVCYFSTYTLSKERFSFYMSRSPFPPQEINILVLIVFSFCQVN